MTHPWKRREVIGDCTLYLGDCREVMPKVGRISAVITDPPYGTETIIVGGYNRNNDTIANDKDLSVVEEAFRVIGFQWVNLWILAFYSPRVENEFYKATSWMTRRATIIWDKKAPGLGGKGIRFQHESIAVFSCGIPEKYGSIFSVLSHYRDAEKHPHQKPIELMKRLINATPGEVVLDPFMGSGTTGVACAKLGRKFVGIEFDEKHFSTACDRIRETYDAPDMFVAAPEPKAEQSALDL